MRAVKNICFLNNFCGLGKVGCNYKVWLSEGLLKLCRHTCKSCNKPAIFGCASMLMEWCGWGIYVGIFGKWNFHLCRNTCSD